MLEAHQHGPAAVARDAQEMDDVRVKAERLLQLYLHFELLLMHFIPIVQHFACNVLQPIPQTLVHLYRQSAMKLGLLALGGIAL